MPSANPREGILPQSTSLPTSKPISISLAPSKAQPPKSTTITVSRSSTTRKRPHSSLINDNDSDPDTTTPTHQAISAFDNSAGGAISANGIDNSKTKQPLVIQGLKNRDWREESRRKRRKNPLPAEVQQAQRQGQRQMNGEGHVERDEVSKVSGLQFVAKEDKDGDGDVEMNTNETAVLRSSAEEQKPKTADEEALEALVADGTRKSTLVVPAVPQAADADEDWRSRRAGAVDEDDHFRSDVASRPDSAGLDDYARVPVEEFGLGMLRGMGWKEGEVVGKNKNQISKPRSVERRPALLGIGAKEVPGGVGEELGAWGKATKGRKGKVDKMYNPVVLRNSRTGEMFTEEELQAKKERQQEEESEWRERREKNLKVDEDRKSERMRRERSMSRESKYHSSRQESPRSRDRSHGSSRREGSSSKERRHQGKKRDYDVDDRREKERRRRNRDDRDDSMSSRHSHRSREEYDDTRRRRNEVY